MKFLAFLIAAIVFLGGAGVALAKVPNGYHYKSEDCSVSGNTVTCTGDIVGLGNSTITANLALGVSATIDCTNGGGNLVEVKTHSVETATASFSSSGNNLIFSLSKTATAPTFTSARAAGCPNNNWTATVTDVSFTGDFTLYWCDGHTLLNLTVTGGSNPPTPVC